MSIYTYTIDNGMKVVLEENRTSPVISFNALINVGSACEIEGEEGISHVIEHMLFKGTPTMPVGAIAKEVEAAGGAPIEWHFHTEVARDAMYYLFAQEDPALLDYIRLIWTPEP